DPGERLYRTGDLVTATLTRDTVELRYLGRSDSQIKLRGNRIEPAEIEAAATAHPDIAHAVVDLRHTPHGPRLALYLVPVDGRSIDTTATREHLTATLTPAMVPDSLTILNSLPLSPTGKLDRTALPEPAWERTATYRAPSTDTERALVQIVGDLLGLDRVGVEDSFFALGGDSIGSIQLVSRAKAQGILLQPRQVFEHQTVAALARVARPGAEQKTLPELPGGGVGSMPLTPVMRLVTGRGKFDRFAQTMALQLPAGIDRDGIVVTLTTVVDHHDALRSRLTDTGLDIVPPGGIDVDALLRRIVVTGDLQETAQHQLDAATARLNPSAGTMLQFVWLDPTEHSRGRLLFVAHHLVVDGVSWRILVPDLVAVWAQLDADTAPSLAPVGTSIRRWAHALTDTAPARTGELEHWRITLAGADPLLGARALDPTLDTTATMGRVDVELPVEPTRRLLTVLQSSFRADAVDGLLAALAIAVRRWRRTRGIDEPTLLVQLEGHGREESLAAGADLTRTVGWFTCVYPARFDLTGIPDHDTDSALKTVKEQRRAIPDSGIGYGLLRELNAETSDLLAGFTAPQISFNYHGRGAGAAPELADLAWTPADDLDGLAAGPDPRMPLPATLDINGGIVESGTGPRFSASIGFAGQVLDESDVEELAEHWVRALTDLVATTGSGLTPSDVPLVAVAQADLDEWHRSFPTVADVWPLTALQEGLAYHAHLAGGGTDPYQTQTVLHLDGAVDGGRLRAAANAMLQRHSALRTTFVTTAAGTPVQVVLDDVEIDWRTVDLAGDDDLGRLRADEQSVPFELSRPPLLRFVLASLPSGAHRLILSLHHIVLDGWSMPLLLRDLLVLYATHSDPSSLPPTPSYRDFLAWLAERDHTTGLDAWRTALAGSALPTLLAPTRGEQTSIRDVTVSTSADLGRRLSTVAGDLAVTTNTVVQAAWGIVLAGWLDRDDVVFGATVSGRPADLDDAEAMVGLFINTIPVRVRLAPADTLATLLSRLQSEQAALLDHHHVGLAEIRAAAGAGADFDTLTVFESYPVDIAALAAANEVAGMRVTGMTGSDATHYPLSLTISADTALHFTVKYDTDAFTHEQIDGLAHRLLRVLDTVAAAPATPVARLDLLSDTERGALVPVQGPRAQAALSWVGLVAAAVEANPAGTAVVWEGCSYSYREVDSAAARVAQALRDRGAGPETLVAVAVP
ncbi:MAG TPA: condensation domain-containing protein, partial [Aldersonia sp.]